jgi:hypothetical protein
VVEFTRDDSGRIREQGRVWHSDLRRVRQFGRVVADNTTGSRVVIADNTGRVVEELPLPELAHAEQGRWQGWRERALPPLPRSGSRQKHKRETATTPAAAWVTGRAVAAATPAAALPDLAQLPDGASAAASAAVPATAGLRLTGPATVALPSSTAPKAQAPIGVPTLTTADADVEVLLL